MSALALESTDARWQAPSLAFAKVYRAKAAAARLEAEAESQSPHPPSADRAERIRTLLTLAADYDEMAAENEAGEGA